MGRNGGVMRFSSRAVLFSSGLAGLFFSLGVLYVRSEAEYALRESASVQRHNVELLTKLGEMERSFVSCVVLYEDLLVDGEEPRRGNIFMSWEEAKKLYDNIVLFEPLERIVLEAKNVR
jgi:hypothetical protein